ncbi:lectin-like domain-containing protein [Tellurirhabdus bombi]|uniref:lectin-like domain-containing protein n=1 Tax=Tellurirhabdus bombi TaxID=2907205 RepID=UPI001F449BA7|nr:gliding motility-associated C-terminal domain-containing protein [Tellurirhabdus bombi]
MSKTLCFFFFFVLVLGHSFVVQGQYQVVGTAQKSTQPGKYILTEARQNQAGAVWHQQQVDLKESFTWRFLLNLGSNPRGADGIAFLLQNKGLKALGSSGGVLGYSGITPSLGIEFDSHTNGNFLDPPYHHVAIQKNGNVDHASPLNLAGPIAAFTGDRVLSDGLDHWIKIEWNASEKKFALSIDCELKVTLTIDLVKEIFGGNSSVWWGVTAGTGGGNNRQTVSFTDPPPLGNRSLVSGCAQETIQLSAPVSIDNQYSWQPAKQLSDPTSKSPTVKLINSQQFTVAYRNECDLPVRDTVLVEVKPLPNIDQSITTVCLLDKQANLDVSTSDTAWTYLWPHSGEKTSAVTVYQTGNYEAKVTTGEGCTQSQFFSVRDTCGLAAVYLPDAFTPNGDGINDAFEVKSLPDTRIDLTIYNSWGEVVFQSSNIENRWDGTYQGKACPADQYSYVLKYHRGRSEGEANQRKQGTITLIR